MLSENGTTYSALHTLLRLGPSGTVTLTWTAGLLTLWLILIYSPLTSLLTSNSTPQQSSNTPPKTMPSSTLHDELNRRGHGDVRVAKILVHPIKSCRGTSIQSARYTPQGLENDRKWCIIDANKLTVITARDVPKMVLITPRLEVDEASPSGGVLTVTFPDESGCASFSIPLQPKEDVLGKWKMLPKITLWPTHDPIDGYICQAVDSTTAASEILSKYFERPVHIVYKGPRPRRVDVTTMFPDLQATSVYQDMYPLLVLSEESIEEMETELRGYVGSQGIDEKWRKDRLLIERFRPNIIFSGGGPFAEDKWEEIEIGAAGAPRITLVSKCTRCLLPNVSPETGEKDKAVPYKVLMKFRTGLEPRHKLKPCVGCNGVPDAEGVVRVGDAVNVKKLIA